ncbi:MAG: hypothetical protein OEZ06_17095 [Myxococcales bacterium]|nr:hypothetical protein [Myxococcales bacterium]
MNTKYTTLFAALLLMLATGTACDQPKPKCTAAHGNFAATFTLVKGEGVCAELSSGVLNVQSYNESKNGPNSVLDQNKPTIAIQSQDTTDVLWSGRETDPDEKTYAFGGFDAPDPDGDGICHAKSLSTAVLKAAATEEVPPMMVDECTFDPGQPAQEPIDIRYDWSNVRVVVTPSAIGTKLEADLEYSVGDCTATYKVAAVWPLVECGSPVEGSGDEPAPMDDPDADAGVDPNCPVEEAEPPPPELEADDSICESQGVIPDFPVHCDPGLLMCVLDD